MDKIELQVTIAKKQKISDNSSIFEFFKNNNNPPKKKEQQVAKKSEQIQNIQAINVKREEIPVSFWKPLTKSTVSEVLKQNNWLFDSPGKDTKKSPEKEDSQTKKTKAKKIRVKRIAKKKKNNYSSILKKDNNTIKQKKKSSYIKRSKLNISKSQNPFDNINLFYDKYMGKKTTKDDNQVDSLKKMSKKWRAQQKEETSFPDPMKYFNNITHDEKSLLRESGVLKSTKKESSAKPTRRGRRRSKPLFQSQNINGDLDSNFGKLKEFFYWFSFRSFYKMIFMFFPKCQKTATILCFIINFRRKNEIALQRRYWLLECW